MQKVGYLKLGTYNGGVVLILELCRNLSWENTVKPWLSQILDDRFIVILGGK